jgi:polyisoprenoid-binding protein YceI
MKGIRSPAMKKYLIPIISVFFCWLTAGQTVQAAPPTWEFDPVHSSFNFGVQHIYSTVHGYFEDFSGIIRFDAGDLAESKIDIQVKTKSITTNSRKRDTHLRSAEFFDAGKYPQMTFTSSAITHVGGDQYEVSGKLTIKDVSRDIVLPLTFHGTKDNPLNPKEVVAGFDSHLTIDRFDYHVGTGKFYDMGVVGKDVTITISLEMLRDK